MAIFSDVTLYERIWPRFLTVRRANFDCQTGIEDSTATGQAYTKGPFL